MILQDAQKQQHLITLKNDITNLQRTIESIQKKQKDLADKLVESINKLKELKEERRNLLDSSIKRFTAEEMGQVLEDGAWIRLSDEFVKSHLDLWELSYYLEPRVFTKAERGLTTIACPFCGNGVLELIEAEKDICETHMVETGMSYKFRCSEECFRTNHKGVLITYSYTHTYC